MAGGSVASAAASNAGKNVASNAGQNVASNASNQATTKVASSNAPKQASSSTPTTTSTPSSSTPTAAPSQSGSVSSGSYQADTNGYRPSSEVSSGQTTPQIPESMKTEGGNMKPVEQLDADELQQAGADFSEGGAELPGQQQLSTPEGTTPDVDELTPQQLEDPDVANSQKDPDQIREEHEANQEKLEQLQEELDSQPQVGDRVDYGKEIKDDGTVDDTATKSTLRAAGKVVAAYYTGGESAGSGADDAILNALDKPIGVISDTVDTVTPGLNEALNEAGVDEVAKAVDHGLSTYGKAKTGDYLGAAKEGAETLRQVDKFKEKWKKKIMMLIIQAATSLLLIIVVILILVGPVIGGVMYLTDKIVEMYSYVTNAVGEFFEDISLDIINSISYQDMLNDTPDYNSLSKERQELISTALLLIGMPYEWGAKPNGPGLTGVPKEGLDCSGFVKWVYWTVLDKQPGFTGTAHIWGNNTELVEISYSELQPGDIGVRRSNGSGHTGIYAGNGMWIHEAGEATGCVRNYYKNFTKFYRHKDIE